VVATTMRIVAGEARGRRLRSAEQPGLRPTLDRVREALFSILGDVTGSSVLDLFAGTGALGIEALSRGAARAVFVEHDRRILDVARSNVDSVGFADRARLELGALPEALAAIVRRGDRFDLVLMDAPYDGSARDATLADPRLAALIADDGTLVVEHDQHHPAPEALGDLRRIDERRYGSTRLSFYQRPVPEAPQEVR
jgi:16S rRNA (guanine966-N2)-methyltransferase